MKNSMKIALNVGSSNVIYKNNNLFFLLILIVVSLSIRLYYLPFEIPITFDGIDYFSFAFEVSKTQKFPTGILHTNDGWPLFLSPIFSIIGNSDFMSLVHAQRITSMVLSTLTIIPVYILTRKFVSSKYALIGAGIFVFDPKLIENSILGITEPIYLLLVSFVLVFALVKNKKLFFISFILLALASIVRYEALLFVIPLSIIFFLRFRNERFSYLKYLLFICIFILILMPIVTLRLDSNNMDGLTSHVFDAVITTSANTVITMPETNEPHTRDVAISSSFFNAIKFLGYVTIPFFLFFLPFGIYNLLKTRNVGILHLIIFGIFMTLPALYAYGRDIEDYRYLFLLFPLFCVISAYGLNLTKKLLNWKYILIILTVIIVSSFLLLDYNQPDHVFEKEIYVVTKKIVNDATGVNSYGGGFFQVAILEQNWPDSLPLRYIPTPHEASLGVNVTNQFVLHPPRISSEGFETLEDYIYNSEDKGLSHIVLLENNRSPLLDDVFINYENYSYLKKTFDSSDYSFENKIIILKIDYSIFDKQLKIKDDS